MVSRNMLGGGTQLLSMLSALRTVAISRTQALWVLLPTGRHLRVQHMLQGTVTSCQAQHIVAAAHREKAAASRRERACTGRSTPTGTRLFTTRAQGAARIGGEHTRTGGAYSLEGLPFLCSPYQSGVRPRGKSPSWMTRGHALRALISGSCTRNRHDQPFYVAVFAVAIRDDARFQRLATNRTQSD